MKCIKVLVLLATASLAWGQKQPATGPLRVLSSNGRYFTDGSGKAIFLTGSHTWTNLEDFSEKLDASGHPDHPFDYSGYLDLLKKDNHNFIRLWRWESPMWGEGDSDKFTYAGPHPWARSGPGLANDGLPKFDLSRYNEGYFTRQRERITTARDRGFYVSVMLFEGWVSQFTGFWANHPFSAHNNIDKIEADLNGDDQGLEFYSLSKEPMSRQVLALQEAYVRKVIDNVNDLDNVLFEICNEAGSYSTEWQYHMIRYVKEYEAKKAKQHPVGMTSQYKGGLNATLFASPADWIAPGAEEEETYRDNPDPAYRGKVVMADTDHLWGHTRGDAVWVWKSFLRGLNVLFMEQLSPSPTWQDSARQAMGQARSYSERIDLANMTPHGEIASSKYCLANIGKEYLVLQPEAAVFTVDFLRVSGSFSVEWLDVNTGATHPGDPVFGGAMVTFAPPFGGPAVVYLKRSV